MWHQWVLLYLPDPVLVEYLQLLSLDQTSLTTATSYWLQAAIVEYRKQLADAEAANATSATNATAAAKNATASAAAAPRLPPLLTLLARELPAPSLLNTTGAYPLPRARSAAAASEDFAVVMAAVLQEYGVHSRVAVLKHF